MKRGILYSCILLLAGCNTGSYSPAEPYFLEVTDAGEERVFSARNKEGSDLRLSFEGNISDTAIVRYATDSLLLREATPVILMPGEVSETRPFYVSGLKGEKVYLGYYPLRSDNRGKFKIGLQFR